MKLVGMLDSPYVRRVAISMQLLGLRFEHQSISVFRDVAAFQRINPVIKVPTLICDDGSLLMDSSLILEYAQALAAPRSLMPATPPALLHELQLIGLALAACEKSVQIVYERRVRPPEKLHEPWVARITGQLLAAFGLLEHALGQRPIELDSSTITQAGVSIAVAWQFVRQMIPDVLPADGFDHLIALSLRAEALPEFIAAPHGGGTFRNAH